jgi:cellulase
MLTSFSRTIQRRWDSHNPIQGATDATLSCNNDGSSLASGAQLTATVSAGTAITANWNNIWPHEQGPQVTYLARCPGTTCDGVNSKTLKWFKIDEAGLLSGTVANGQWGAGKMVKQGSTWTSTIPKSVPSGPYLIRFETIALHLLPAVSYSLF